MKTALANLLHQNRFDSSDFSKFFTSSKSKDKKRVVECAVKKANEYQLEVENKHTKLKKKQRNHQKTT